MASAEGPAPHPVAFTAIEKNTPSFALVWFGALLVLAYAPVLLRLVGDWSQDENMGHGFFVPILAGWFAWQKRTDILNFPCKPNYWGIIVLIWGAVQLVVATLGAEFFLARLAFVISLVGLILTLCGIPIVRALMFPLFLLLFMIPLPSIIYNQITFPLQLFASSVAEFSLSGLGIPVLREGNILELPSQRLSVVEACSGIRSLLSLSFLSLVYAHVFDSKPWMKPALLIATVPIAVLANASRVTLTGILSEYKREWAEGAFHLLEGWVIFMVALAALIVTHRIINRIYERTHVQIKSS